MSRRCSTSAAGRPPSPTALSGTLLLHADQLSSRSKKVPLRHHQPHVRSTPIQAQCRVVIGHPIPNTVRNRR